MDINSLTLKVDSEGKLVEAITTSDNTETRKPLLEIESNCHISMNIDNVDDISVVNNSSITFDNTTPDTTTPDTTATTATNATTPDATTPDTTATTATTATNATTPDATTPDATTPDATTPDATTPDATAPDTIKSAEYDTLVLSGTSTKGFIILGALQYAFDNFLLNNLKTYIGTSSGSIISYLLAIGYTPIEIMVYMCTNQMLEKMQNFNIVAMIQGRGACSYSHIQEQLEKLTINKIGYFPTLLDLKEKYGKTLICVTHNLTEKRTEYLSWEIHPNLPCLTAIRMSSNLPLIFEKYQYGNCFYVDGGISDNFAIDIGDNMGKKVLGILLDSIEDSFNKVNEASIVEYIYELIFTPIEQSTKCKLANVSNKCHIVRLDSDDTVKFFQFDINTKSKLGMFSSGYQRMKVDYESKHS
jgi:predicted acylesterase/phospholipase RssA